MEGLNPPLKCLIEIQSALHNAQPVRSGLQQYLFTAEIGDGFASAVRRLIFAWDQGQDWRKVIVEQRSPYRRALLELMTTAFSGQPILGHLEELKAEIIAAAESEINYHLEILPVKMLIPLLLFQFPAFLILLFGPLLARLLQEIAN